jgi:hypothetical protein
MALSMLAVMVSGVAITATPASATTPMCGESLLPGGSWMNGQGVDVRSNGQYTNQATDCGSFVANMSANPPQMGDGWQCVELAQRLYNTRGWYSGTFAGVGAAADIYAQAVAGNLSNMSAKANGSITSIAPGDMIVHGTGDVNSSAGHVAIVDYVSGSTVHAVQQNAGSTTVSYTLNSGTLTGGSGSDIKGVVHAGGNTLSSGTVTSSNDVVVREGSTMFGKVGLDDGWTTLTDAAGDIQAAGNMFAYRNGTTLFVKQGLGGTWYNEASGVDQYVITPDYVVVREGSVMYGRSGPNGPWVTLTNAAANIQAAGNRFAYLTSGGTLWVKDGLGGTWYNESVNVDQYVITPNYVVVRSGATVIAKAGLTDGWTTLTDAAASVKASGNRFAYLSLTGTLFVKQELGGMWYTEASGVDEYVLS